MPIIRENLLLPDGFSLKPNAETYVRVGKVVSVSLFSREILIQYVDGEHTDEGQPVEAVVWAIAVAGSDDPSTTFAPSAAVYGRSDLVAVVIMGETGERYVVSPMDDYEGPNRRGYALVNGWCLFDVLNCFVVDILDEGASSFIEFWDFNANTLTRIHGNPDEVEGKRVMRRMLDYFGTIGQPDGSICHTLSGSYPAERLGGGPPANPQERLFGSHWLIEDDTLEQFDVLTNGPFVNGFKQVVDIPHGAADLTASLSAHHSTLTYLGKAKCHPLSSSTIEIFYNPTVFRFGDVDSDFVVIAAVFPAWDTCSYINFIEIPVYALAERKRIHLDEENTDDITHAWQLYAEDIRVLKTIPRNYVEWNALATDFMYSERASRALPILSSRFDEGESQHTFGILDSRSWVIDGTPPSILDPAKINRIVGAIKRTAKPEDEYAENGSPWNYQITHNDPITGTGIIDNWYTSRVQYYNDGAGDVWEKHTCMTPTKVYPVITDGTHEFTKKIDFLFDITGELTYNEGNQEWDDFEEYSTHSWWEHFYLDGVHVYTDTYQRVHTTDPQQNIEYDVTSRIIHHIDMELGLIVAEEHVYDAEGYLITGTTIHTIRCVVFWAGVRYVIWEIVFTDNHFPYRKNWPYPWCADNIKDGNYPTRPTSVPHDYDQNYNSVFFWPPHIIDYSTDPFPFNTGTKGKALSYPYLHGECTVQVMFGKILNDYSVADEGPTGTPYLQVSTDVETGAWVVRAPMWAYARYASDSVSSYPGTFDTLSYHPDINDGNLFYGVVNPEDSALINADDMLEFYAGAVPRKIITLGKAEEEI